MRLLGRWFGGRMWVFLLLAVVVFALQLLLPWPVLLTYGLLLSAAIVLVADPVRVAVLSVVCLALGAVAPFVDPAPPTGYWERYPWLLPFAVLAVVLARVERDRVRRIARSVQLLDEVVEATSQPIFAKRFGAPGQPATFDLANDAWRRAVGIEDVQVRGLADTEVFSAEALAAMRPDEEQVARTGSPATFEQHLVLADGEERTYLTTIFPLLGDDAAVAGVGGIATDVTERRGPRSASPPCSRTRPSRRCGWSPAATGAPRCSTPTRRCGPWSASRPSAWAPTSSSASCTLRTDR